VAVTVDMLVLRESLIPQTPLPYGQRPKPGIRLRDKILLRETYLEELRGVTARRKVLKRLLKALDEETLEAEPPPPGLPRPASTGLTLTMTTPLVPVRRRPAPGAETPPPERPRPDKPRRRKS